MKRFILSLILLSPCVVKAQQDLLQQLEKDTPPETEYAFATFKGTRLGNGHTIETKSGGSMEFIFGHRFGPINGGAYELYGLDQAYVRLGLDYGITDRLAVSIGRTSTDKTIDGYLKYRAVRQSKGAKNFPVSITLLGGMAYRGYPKNNADISPEYEYVDRLSYTGQALIARKFSPALSLQLMPTLIHKNYVESYEENNQFALGFGGRVKISKSMALTAEYYFNMNRPDTSTLPDGVAPYYDAMSIGLDIETGGHVFQILLTNAIGLTERAFITETHDDFFDGAIHLGFNVTRNFQLTKKSRTSN
ncbi:DUF5777 family beta-barrel protein [Chryseolinea sp. T2]|uniref:DUF5777 family beta-barrel protein n=1 Tax=Chryseolinea sp. T2 TaxID=3129255 RepID=UPI0030788438